MTTIWRKGYKLLNPYDRSPGRKYRRTKGRVSLCVGNQQHRCVDYPLMEEARPQPGAGPLTVFTRKADIHRFFDANGWEYIAVVVRCIFKQSKDQGQGLWGSDEKPKYHPLRDLPPGTVLADVVICLE